MDITKFFLNYYQTADAGMHVQKVETPVAATKPHTHAYFQIYYILKGSLTHYVEDVSSRLSKGDMFIVPPERIHYIHEETSAVFYSFSFMPDSLPEDRLVKNFLYSLSSETIRPKITVPSDDLIFVEGIMEQIYREFVGKKLGYQELLRSYAMILLARFARSYFEQNPKPLIPAIENYREFVMQCVQYINLNFAEDISLEQMARHSAMSKSHFCKLFLELTGHSFHKYLNLCRIQQGAKYIKEGYKITGIYGLCGYNDFTTFYRNFKSIMGVSPSEYKQAIQKG